MTDVTPQTEAITTNSGGKPLRRPRTPSVRSLAERLDLAAAQSRAVASQPTVEWDGLYQRLANRFDQPIPSWYVLWNEEGDWYDESGDDEQDWPETKSERREKRKRGDE